MSICIYIGKVFVPGDILKKWVALLSGMAICIVIGACSIKKTDEKKLKDVDYTVVENEDIPKELKKLIENKQEEKFTMTYDNKEYLYIVAGFGAQPTSGYSVTVSEIYETKNSICFAPGLKGPDKTEEVNSIITYPYIVVKIEYTDKTVLFK